MKSKFEAYFLSVVALISSICALLSFGIGHDWQLSGWNLFGCMLAAFTVGGSLIMILSISLQRESLRYEKSLHDYIKVLQKELTEARKNNVNDLLEHMK